MSVTSSPFQLLRIFFVLDPMLRSITWKTSIKIWPAASQLHEQCGCKVLARKHTLADVSLEVVGFWGQGEVAQIGRITVWPGNERMKSHPSNYIPVKLLALH